MLINGSRKEFTNKPNNINDKKSTNFASRIIYNADIVKKDSGMVKVRFKAPLLEEYEFVDTPYVVVRKGLYLEFYDS